MTHCPLMRLARSLPTLAGLSLVLLAAACVTIKVYFPAARIQRLSDAIEAEVERQGGEAPAEPAPEAAPATPDGAAPGSERESGPPRADRPSWRPWALEVAHAQEEVPPPSVTSPAIRKIIASRAARLGALRRFKDAGAIGESNQALVEVRDADAVADLAQRAELQRVVKQENEDRELLFREIASVEGVALSQLPRIRETYAATIRERAHPGDLVQEPDGSWTRKR